MGKNIGKKIGLMLKLISLGGVAIHHQEGLPFVDDSQIRMDSKNAIIDQIETAKHFSVMYDEYNNVEIRDNEGMLVLDFEVDDNSIEDIKKLNNIMTKDEFSRDHYLLNRRIVAYGNNVYQETYNEETDKSLYFTKITNEENFGYKIDGIGNLIQLVNALSGNNLEFLDKTVTDEGTKLRLINFDTAEYLEYKEGSLRSILGEALKATGVSVNAINDFLHLDPSEEVETKIDEAELVLGGESQLAHRIYESEEENPFFENSNGELELRSNKQLKVATRNEIICYIEEELNSMKNFTGNEEFDANNIGEFLRDSIHTANLTGDEITKLYDFIVLSKDGNEGSMFRRTQRELRLEIKEFCDEYGDKTLNTKLKKKSMKQLTDYFREEEEKTEEEVEKEIMIAEENKSKVDKQVEYYNMSQKKNGKDLKNIEEFKKNMVLDHEDKAYELMEYGQKLNNLSIRTRYGEIFEYVSRTRELERKSTLEASYAEYFWDEEVTVDNNEEQIIDIPNSNEENVKISAKTIENANSLFYGDDENSTVNSDIIPNVGENVQIDYNVDNGIDNGMDL